MATNPETITIFTVTVFFNITGISSSSTAASAFSACPTTSAAASSKDFMSFLLYCKFNFKLPLGVKIYSNKFLPLIFVVFNNLVNTNAKFWDKTSQFLSSVKLIPRNHFFKCCLRGEHLRSIPVPPSLGQLCNEVVLGCTWQHTRQEPPSSECSEPFIKKLLRFVLKIIDIYKFFRSLKQ